jgi:NRAMP (natural resistance-associated macrophage protein)-like metal ion transporter
MGSYRKSRLKGPAGSGGDEASGTRVAHRSLMATFFRSRRGWAPRRSPPEGVREGEIKREASRLRGVFKILGPGLITGASDDDPSGVGTYAVAGASLGYATLWMAWATFPLMAAVQFIAAKIGIVTGVGIAGVLCRHYPRWIGYSAALSLAVACTINAGADIGAIAAALNLVVPMPGTALVVPIAGVIVALQILGSYRMIARIFTWLTLALLAYIASAIFAVPNAGEVLWRTFVPTVRFDRPFLLTTVAILGTTISPYMWFWQASQEVEEMVDKGQRRLWQRRGATDAELRYAAWDVNIGMVASNVVMYFIILSTAATLFRAGHTDIQSARDAAEALRPLAGNAASTLFALGLIGAGMLAVPVLTGSAAYALGEVFGWKVGFEKPLHAAPQFYGVLLVSTLVGVEINFLGINPIDALFWTAVMFGFLAPPIIVLMIRIANDRRIMGARVNGIGTNLLGWATTLVMAGAAVALVVASAG